MKLFFDESVGTRVPEALRHIAVPCQGIFRPVWPSQPGTIKYGMTDLEWLQIAGAERYLAVSHDAKMLEVPAEREAIRDAGVGLVVINAGQAPRWRILRLLLDRWEWLDRIDREPRPFAYVLSLRGRVRARPLA